MVRNTSCRTCSMIWRCRVARSSRTSGIEMLAGDFKAVAIGAGHDGRAPTFGKARNIRHLVGDAITQDQAASPAKLPPMMMTSSMVMGSVLWLGWAWLAHFRYYIVS